MKNLTQTLLFTFLLSFSSNNVAQNATAHENVESLVEQYVYQQHATNDSLTLAVEAFPIDERIDIAPCAEEYQLSMSETATHQTYTTVKVSCPASNWYLFVNAKVEQRQQVVVTGEMLSPNTILTQQNLATADINVQRLRHTTFDQIEQLAGARIKHRVRAGQPITPNMVCFVCKGDLITLSANAAGLIISTKGVAQQDGNIGDTIKVMNRRTEKMVLAKVADHDTAVVNI